LRRRESLNESPASRIFISYSSKHREICERLQLALEAGGRHEVFVDRAELPPGQPFDEKIRQGLLQCDLLLFLVSPESVAPGSYALAWLRYNEVIARHPARASLNSAREDCGMRWLRGEIRLQVGKETVSDIVDKIMPVLTEGAAAAAVGQRGADLRAHMGWADFLRLREGVSGMNPPAHYERALALDPGNVYAHTMWAHHVMVQSESIDGAKKHLAAALAGGRERAYVRSMQFAAMLY
jgi:TIR domain